MTDRVPMDVAAYVQRSRQGPCFVCATLADHPDYQHEIVYDDGEHAAFLSRYPTVYGYVLVVPRRHVEHLVRDLSEDEYLRLQRVVYRVARAVEAVVPSEHRPHSTVRRRCPSLARWRSAPARRGCATGVC